MGAEQMESFLDTVILTLFGDAFSPREEYLILKLFQVSFSFRFVCSFRVRFSVSLRVGFRCSFRLVARRFAFVMCWVFAFRRRFVSSSFPAYMMKTIATGGLISV